MNKPTGMVLCYPVIAWFDKTHKGTFHNAFGTTEPTEEQIAQIQSDFAVLENAVKAKDFAVVDSLLDVESFISMLQLQEYLYNVDFTAPRSLYMFRDVNGKYTMGPVWDWDAGYDFD
jgi:spore coat protein CotH